MKAPPKSTISAITILVFLVGVLLLGARFTGKVLAELPLNHGDLVDRLSSHSALPRTAETLLTAARRGEMEGLLATGSPAFAISEIVPWSTPHILTESNSAAFGVYVFEAPRSPAGFCVFEGERTKLRYGPHSTTITSNVFVFTFR